MTPVETAVAPGLVEAIRVKLRHAPVPLKFKDIAKGLPRPKKVSAADAEPEVRKQLDELVRQSGAYCYPSGKGGELRYWGRDEKHLLREKVLEIATAPQSLSNLKAIGKQAVKADGPFVEAQIRELIGESRLHEHTPKGGKGGSLFGASPPPPPPPPLEQSKHQAGWKKVVDACQRLLAATGASVEDLLGSLRGRMQVAPTAASPSAPAPIDAQASPQVPAPPLPPPAPVEPAHALTELILKAVANAPVVSLADLRAEMPSEYQGPAFDAVVLRLADEQRVIISQDDDASRFSDADRERFVSDGRFVFTTIAQWS